MFFSRVASNHEFFVWVVWVKKSQFVDQLFLKKTVDMDQLFWKKTVDGPNQQEDKAKSVRNGTVFD